MKAEVELSMHFCFFRFFTKVFLKKSLKEFYMKEKALPMIFVKEINKRESYETLAAI